MTIIFQKCDINVISRDNVNYILIIARVLRKRIISFNPKGKHINTYISFISIQIFMKNLRYSRSCMKKGTRV